MTDHLRPRQAEPRGVLRALGALGALGVLVVVVPYVLVALTRALPVDLGALAPAAWGHADDGRLLLLAIVGVAWVAWGVMVLSVGLEVSAAVRRVPTRSVPGLAVPQRLAAGLVAAVLVALSPAAGGTSAATAAAPGQVGQLSTTGVAATLSARPDPASRGSAPESATARSVQSDQSDGRPTVTTQRHDTLWLLAEHHLGAGERYTEIVDLNRGVRQPDGRSLGEGGRLYPGWTLALPSDATVGAARAERHRVVRGDTLWQIAEDELGDATRYPEIAGANLGDLQPDGRRLTDPDLILPGWVLEIPGSEAEGDTVVPDHAGQDEEPVSVVPRGTGIGSSGTPSPIDRATRPGVATPSASESAPATAASAGVPLLDRGGAVAAESTAARPTVEPTVTTPTQDPTAQAPSAVSAAESGAGIALPSGGVAAALLLAGVGAELVRRRRQFQRHRRPGERMPVPRPGARDLERAARAAVREPGLDLLDRALAQLAESAHASGRPLPDVRLVRVGAESVTLDLAAPAGSAIAPFVATDDSRWVLSAGLLAAEAPGRTRALPALATLGFVGDATVLINLESVGTLAVTGSQAATGDVLRGMAAELALGPVSSLTERVLCLADPTIAGAVEAGGIGVEPDPARAAAALSAALGHAIAADPPLVVLADQDLGLWVPPRSGCALITTAPVIGAGATLVIDDAGAAVLLPEREHLVLQRLSRTTTADIVAALSAADLPETLPGAPAHAPEASCAPRRGDADLELGSTADPGALTGQSVLWESEELPPAVIDLRDIAIAPVEASAQLRLGVQASPSAAPDGAPSPVPRVLVLGEVLVENAHGRCESTRIGRLAETAAFVMLHPGARPSELQGALWPGRRSNPQTCRQMISRARTWLGRTDAGEPYLMTFAESEGRLRLREEVGSDWAEFQRLAQVGLADPDDTEHLTAALALVRGRPFGAVASRELPWADIHINEMISLITDVAHALAVRHEEAGRLAAARDAALRGLRTESESVVLEAIVARTRV